MFESLPDILTAKEVFEALRIRHSSGYVLLENGTIPSFRIGNRICVPKEELIKFVRKQMEATRQDNEKEDV